MCVEKGISAHLVKTETAESFLMYGIAGRF